MTSALYAVAQTVQFRSGSAERGTMMEFQAIIAAVIGEELGLVGITVLIITFCIIAWRGLRAAVLAPDRFGSLLAIGLTTMVAVQAFFNLSVVTGLLPNKGLPLPLVSNGGSSLLINLVGMGILLNISQQASTVAATKVGVDPEV